jgi:hypothetical protein
METKPKFNIAGTHVGSAVYIQHNRFYLIGALWAKQNLSAVRGQAT